MRHIQITAHGGVEQLIGYEHTLPPLASDQVEVRNAYAGVNYVDIYQREGRYPGLKLPMTLGIEGSGVVHSAPLHSGFKNGDRVAYCDGVQGSYAELVRTHPQYLVPVPAALSLRDAAAAIEQGLTAHMLLNSVTQLAALAPEKAGKLRVLVHAASGGVGGWLVQWLKRIGAQVLGLASSAEKRAWLDQLGVAHADSAGNWQAAAHAFAPDGFDVVFDSVGLATFESSLKLTKTCGHVVLYGAASGPVAQVPVPALMQKSLTLTRPRLPDYIQGSASLLARSNAVFDTLLKGEIALRVDSEYTLQDVAAAHVHLTSRAAAGKVLLAINPALEQAALSSTLRSKNA